MTKLFPLGASTSLNTLDANSYIEHAMYKLHIASKLAVIVNMYWPVRLVKSLRKFESPAIHANQYTDQLWKWYSIL